MLDVIIVDDEAASRHALREYCTGESDLRIIGEYSDGYAAVDAIKLRSPDVLFLDIRMDYIDGVSLARSLERGNSPLVVFVTAYEQYAASAFELGAVDYLLKPFGHDRFRATIDRLRWRVAVDTPARQHNALCASTETKDHRQPTLRPPSSRILVGFGDRFKLLDMNSIEAIKADRNYIALIVGPEIHHLRGTLQEAEHSLRLLPIVRISRSCLVNMSHVQEISRTPRRDFILVLTGGMTLTSSETFRDAVREYLGRYKLLRT